MKKTLTLLLVALTSISIAQVELEMKSIDKPADFIMDGEGSTKLQLQFTLQNNGSELKAADTIIYTWGIINKNPVQYIVQGNPGAFILPQNIPTGGTYQSQVYDITINGTINQKTPVYVLAEAYVINRSTPAIDSDSTNNGKLKEMDWVTLSTKDITYNHDNIAVYPNPANDQLNVELLFAESNAVSIELFDLTGKSVNIIDRTRAISPNQYSFDVADFNQGIYILKVTNGEKVSTTKVTIAH